MRETPHYFPSNQTPTAMTIKEFYVSEFPTDELGAEINENATFDGLLNVLQDSTDVYNYLQVGDSIVRERVFEELAGRLNESYDFVYNMWVGH